MGKIVMTARILDMSDDRATLHTEHGKLVMPASLVPPAAQPGDEVALTVSLAQDAEAEADLAAKKLLNLALGHGSQQERTT